MAHLAPANKRHKLTELDVRRVDAARLAIRMHLTLAEVYAMPMSHFATLADVMRADDEIKRVEDHRRANRQGSAARRSARSRRRR